MKIKKDDDDVWNKLTWLSDWDFQVALVVRRFKRCGIDPWMGKIPWRKAWQPSSVFLPGESYGQKNLAGYHPWCSRDGHS